MSNFDLDIKNYSIYDLATFLKINVNNYDKEEVDEQIKNMYKKICDLDIEFSFKEQFKVFLKSVKEILNKNINIITENILTKNIVTENIDNNKPIVQKPNLPFIYSDSSKYFTVSNQVNQIEKHLNTVLLSIDTLFRQNYFITSSTDFIYTLPTTIKNVASMQLVAMELPRVFFEFSNSLSNNYFTIRLYNMCYKNIQIPDEEHIIVIPEGHYTYDTFKTSLINLFINNTYNSTDSTTGNSTNNLNFICIDIDPTTSKTTIRTANPIDTINNQNCNFKFPYIENNDTYNLNYVYTPGTSSNPNYSPDFYFELDFTSINNNMYENLGWMLGFRKKKYTIKNTDIITNNIICPTILTFKGVLISESTFGSNYNNYLYLEINDFNNNNQSNNFLAYNSSNSYISNNILARITLNNVPNTIIENNASDYIYKKREYYGPVNIDKLHIRLLNRYGKIVDMNKNDYSFVLKLKQIYS
jgi:hypothetical protein